MKHTVIYHSADFDGLFCREIARKFLPPDTEFIGWNFGDAAVPIPPKGTIYVMDLPVDRVFGGAFHASGTSGVYLGGDDFTRRLVWIDHHKSSIETHPHWLAGYRLDGVAACRLAWQWFKWNAHLATPSAEEVHCHMPSKQDFVNRQVAEPHAVRLAGEYDIWDKRDPDAEVFQYGLASTPALEWQNVFGADVLTLGYIDWLLHRGATAQQYQRGLDEKAITSRGFTLHWEGLTFLACNAARYNSHLFTAGLKPEHDACLGFCFDGHQWHVSLYHAPGKESHDLSVIAKAYGGGGHRGACGFVRAWPPFLARPRA